MKVFVLFVVFLALALAHPGSLSKSNALRTEQLQKQLAQTAFGQKYLTDTRVRKSATISDFKIYFYTRNNTDHPVVVMYNDVTAVVNSKFFNPDARCISITHGWNNKYSSDVNTILTEAILGSYDVNVFVTDWGSVANLNYITAESAVNQVGTFLGEFINKVVTASGISYKQFTLIGHSLGAHVAGAAGSKTNEKVDLIFGLDPALPLIGNTADKRLDPTDADFVQIIHTCGGYLGYYEPIGTADYYPNGGENFQPGCNMIQDIVGTCSHGRSYIYLGESISNSTRKFWGYVCDDYDTFERGSCTDKETASFMGTLEPDKSASGSYWLRTKGKSPYALDVDLFADSSA